MSAAGMVTGSTKEKGSLDPGGGLRNWGFRGTPLERLGSTAKKRRMVSQIPVDWRVYFYGLELAFALAEIVELTVGKVGLGMGGGVQELWGGVKIEV